MVRKAAEIGDGSVSAGIRMALEAFKPPVRLAITRPKTKKTTKKEKVKLPDGRTVIVDVESDVPITEDKEVQKDAEERC